MFLKKILAIVIIFYSITFSLYADEKKKIISQLSNLKSLEFSFNQLINDKVESGNCLLQFPGKLK